MSNYRDWLEAKIGSAMAIATTESTTTSTIVTSTTVEVKVENAVFYNTQKMRLKILNTKPENVFQK
jgi:hypothetical protein